MPGSREPRGWWRRLFGREPAAPAGEVEAPEVDWRADARFAPSLEALHDPGLAVRLAALDALAARLVEAEEGPGVLGFLTAWIRSPTPLAADEDDVDEDGFELDYPLRRDVHAALTAVATRQPWEPAQGPRALDLGGAYLGRATLDGADLCGADLREVDLRQASLRGARLVGARMSACDMGSADLTQACLDEARFTHGFVTAGKLVRASLQRLEGTKLDLREADASGADFRGSQLPWAILRRTRLLGADLGGVTGLSAPDLRASFLDAATVAPEGIGGEQWAELVAGSPTLGRAEPPTPDA